MAVSVNSKRELAYRRLVRLILSGAIDEAKPLSERKLSQTLKIGRTPVREALHQLASEGLIQVRPARGSFVRQISKTELHEVFELREALEGMAAALAAKRGPTKKLLAFTDAFEKIANKLPNCAAEQLDARGAAFHIEIVNAARNRILKDNYEPLRRRSRLAFDLSRYSNADWARQSVREHQEILDAIIGRDPARAERQMRKHILNGLAVRLRIYDEFEGGTSGREEANHVHNA